MADLDLINELIRIENTKEKILSKARDTQTDLKIIKDLFINGFNKKLDSLIDYELKNLEKQNLISLKQNLDKIQEKHDIFFDSIKNDLADKKNNLIDKIFQDLLNNLLLDLDF